MIWWGGEGRGRAYVRAYGLLLYLCAADNKTIYAIMRMRNMHNSAADDDDDDGVADDDTDNTDDMLWLILNRIYSGRAVFACDGPL